MANVTTSRSKQKAKEKIKVKIIPLTENARKLNYVRINGKVLPFEVPIIINEQDLKALKNMKEPRKVDSGVNVHQIMETLQIPQEKANKIAKQRDIENSKLQWIKKFHVEIL